MKKTLSMLAIMSAVLVSCTKSEINENNGNNGNPPDEPVYEISISPKDLTFGAKGGDQTVTVTSSEDWYLDGESDWCKVSASYGSNGDKVMFSADPYENTDEERTATFTFYCGDKDVELVVTQEAKVYSISVEPKELEFESSADEKTVTITSSDDWDFLTEEDWISVSEQNGETGASVKVIVTENDKAEIRTGVATFRCGDKQADVKITQEAKEFSISVEPKELMFEAEGGKYEITVTSSDEWSISRDDYWLSYTKNEDNENLIIISAGANFTGQSRSCTLTFTCGDKTAELIVTQKPDDSPIIQFKDPYFLNALIATKAVDKNKDDQISELEAKYVTNLNLNYQLIDNKVRKIDELSYFTSLNSLTIELFCEEDVSLILNNHENLKSLCVRQKFDKLDLSNCKQLEEIETLAGGVIECNSINLSGCSALKLLRTIIANNIIDVSGCPLIENLRCASMTSLNIRGCSALKDLHVSSSTLNSIDLSTNYSLEELTIWAKLSTLDLSNNTALTRLDCTSNQLTSLDLKNKKALTYLDCTYNELTSLDVNNCSALSELRCNDNQLTVLDISNCIALAQLFCYNNKLTSLDLSKSDKLSWLYCNNNNLTSLDLSKNSKLFYFNCNNNNLTSLDLRNNHQITQIDCSNNPLTRIVLYKYHMLDDYTISIITNEYGDIIEYVE